MSQDSEAAQPDLMLPPIAPRKSAQSSATLTPRGDESEDSDTVKQEAFKKAKEKSQELQRRAYEHLVRDKEAQAIANAGKYKPVDDLPSPEDEPSLPTLQEACLQGDLPGVQSLVQSKQFNSTCLHQGLLHAIYKGQADVVRYLLDNEAPITREVQKSAANFACSSTNEEEANTAIRIFEAFVDHGWDVNSPGYYGAPVLPMIVRNELLLRWFLTHGADPNLGPQRFDEERLGYSYAKSGAALNSAARGGTQYAVDLLLEAGASKESSVALHHAAGTIPYSATRKSEDGPMHLTLDEDREQIPMIAHLIACGFDVNALDDVEGPYKIGKPLDYAFRVQGANERIRFLLDHGAESVREDEDDRARNVRFGFGYPIDQRKL